MSTEALSWGPIRAAGGQAGASQRTCSRPFQSSESWCCHVSGTPTRRISMTASGPVLLRRSGIRDARAPKLPWEWVTTSRLARRSSTPGQEASVAPFILTELSERQ